MRGDRVIQSPNRCPGVVWSLRRENLNDRVQTAAGDRIEIHVDGQVVSVTRTDAAAIIRRLRECLDYTLKGSRNR